MINVSPFAGLPIAVFGLGHSGIAAAVALQQSSARVWAWDDSNEARKVALEAGVNLVNLYECDWSKLTTLVLSPGIPLHHPEPNPVVTLAKKANCEVIGDVELLCRTQQDASYVGITGTNGKSTTTSLVGHILQLSGRNVEVGGNLGIAALTLAPLGDEGIYVLEMSSYQLDLIETVTFDVAVLLNITQDHLDRHGGLDGYVATKKTIFNRQVSPRMAVIGVDDDYSQEIFRELRSNNDQWVVPVSGQKIVKDGVYVQNGILIDNMDGSSIPITDLRKIATLPGEHNWQNAAAAYAATRGLGVPSHDIMDCLQSYPGLAHRQELVERVEGILFVNDSKATNPDSTAKALNSYKHIYWIAGGRSKGLDLEPIKPHLRNVRHIFLIGEAAGSIDSELRGKVTTSIYTDLALAVIAAHNKAISDGINMKAVVLLSPACTSFDQFINFEARGNYFKEIVSALPGKHTDAENIEDELSISGIVK